MHAPIPAEAPVTRAAVSGLGEGRLTEWLQGRGMQEIRTFFPPNGGKSMTQLYLLPAPCVRSNA